MTFLATVTALFLLPNGKLPLEHIKLRLIPDGATQLVDRYSPILLPLTRDRPKSLIKTFPFTRPTFGVIDFEDKDHALVLDESASGQKLYFDANANGDLSDDGPTTWDASPYTGKDGKQYTQHRGHISVNLNVEGKPTPVTLRVYSFDPKDPGYEKVAGSIYYYSDYASEGEMSFGGMKHHVVVYDWDATGFKPFGEPGDRSAINGMRIAVDINDNGKFESRGERFSIYYPFNISGTTYQISNLKPTSLDFDKSKISVSPVPITPVVGDVAPDFAAATIDGQNLTFPRSYRGKLVLLYFWAMSVRNSTKELPALVDAYKKFHGRSLEILGINTDLPKAAKELDKYLVDNGMPWPEVSEKYPYSEGIIPLFAVKFLPAGYLIDGDTGKIIASIETLRGDKLAPTVEAALIERKR